jgi:hypothetical protein
MVGVAQQPRRPTVNLAAGRTVVVVEDGKAGCLGYEDD